VSLLASYLRLAGFNQTYRWVLYAAMTLVILNQLIYTFLLSFACRPIAKQWDPRLPGTCIHQLDTYFGELLEYGELVLRRLTWTQVLEVHTDIKIGVLELGY